MKHQYYEMLISAMMDDNLSEEEKVILDNHIAKCSKCQKIKKEFTSLSTLLNSESINIKSDDFIFTKQKSFSGILKIAATIIFISLFGIASFIGIKQYRSNDINYAISIEKNKNKEENEKLIATIDDRIILTTFTSYFETNQSNEDDSPFSTYFNYLDK